MNITKKKQSLIAVVVLALSTVAVVYLVCTRKNNDALGSPIVTGISKHACTSSRKCFDLQGKAYIVSEQDAGAILDMLADTVKQKRLTDNNEFKLVDSSVLSRKNEAVSTDSAQANGFGISLISLAYSGGLFGEYNFPYSDDGHALYVASFAADKQHSDSDLLYILRSEFDTTDEQSQTILNMAKTLPKDVYVLLVAEK